VRPLLRRRGFRFGAPGPAKRAEFDIAPSETAAGRNGSLTGVTPPRIMFLSMTFPAGGALRRQDLRDERREASPF